MSSSFLEVPRSSHGSVSPRIGIRKPRQSIGASPITGLMQDRYKQLLGEFEQIDKNGDKQLTYEEIYDFLSEKQGAPYDHKLCREIFTKMDRNHDNIVSTNEFLWSYVETEDMLQARIKDIKKNICDNSRKMDDFKKKLIQARTQESYNRFGIMNGSVLTVEVLEAKDLIPMDSNGLSDPYVILKCEKQQEMTKVIPETLSPVWNEEFTFKIESGDSELQIIVMDKDIGLKDDFEGEVKIKLSTLKDQMKHDQYFNLSGNPQAINGNCGKIRLSLHWIWSKTRYLEEINKQWQDVLDSDKKDLQSFEDQLNKIKKPFGHLDRQSEWTIREERSVSTRITGFEPAFGGNFDLLSEKKIFYHFDSGWMRILSLLLYIFTSIMVMYARSDFVNVKLI